MKCYWKEASTLILSALNQNVVKTSWNYSVLTLQRSLKSSFMPNGYVFPGGTTESVDSNERWLELLSDFKIDCTNVSNIKNAGQLFQEDDAKKIPKLLSLKITAIRETFEETGILLCVNKKEKLDNFASYSIFEGLDVWRSKVQKNASEFLNLCCHYNCCPDVKNLHLWSNWLTPTSMGAKRFDTAFFIACLNEHPVAVADNKEVEKLIWSTPEKLLESCKNKEIWLPPPQVYESSRLFNFKDIEALENFSASRSLKGCERWMPVQVKTLNGSVSLLPGDDAYKATDFCTPTERSEVNMTTEEYRSPYKVLHRMEFLNKFETKVVVKNYSPTNGHVLPKSEC